MYYGLNPQGERRAQLHMVTTLIRRKKIFLHVVPPYGRIPQAPMPFNQGPQTSVLKIMCPLSRIILKRKME